MPSVKVESGHYASHFKKESNTCWCEYRKENPTEEVVFTCFRCHTWVNDGKAQFLPDSTHEHAGKTLDLLEVSHA